MKGGGTSLKAKNKASTTFSAAVKLISDGKTMNRVIEGSLSPDNKIDPPAEIKSVIRRKGVYYYLDGFKQIDSLLRAINDILEAVQLVERLVHALDERESRK